MDLCFKQAALLAGVDEGLQKSFRNKTNPPGKKLNKVWHWLTKPNVKKGWDEMCRLAESAHPAGRPQCSGVAGGSTRAPPACPSGFSCAHESLQSLHLAETLCCVNKGKVSSQRQELSLMEKTCFVERNRWQHVYVPPHLSSSGAPHARPSWGKQVERDGAESWWQGQHKSYWPC